MTRYERVSAEAASRAIDAVRRWRLGGKFGWRAFIPQCVYGRLLDSIAFEISQAAMNEGDTEIEACATILDPLRCSEECGVEHSGSCYTMLAAEMRARKGD